MEMLYKTPLLLFFVRAVSWETDESLSECFTGGGREKHGGRKKGREKLLSGRGEFCKTSPKGGSLPSSPFFFLLSASLRLKGRRKSRQKEAKSHDGKCPSFAISIFPRGEVWGEKHCRKWEGPISTKRDKKILFSRHPFLLITTRGRCSLPFSKKNETEGLNIYLLSNVNGSTPAEGQYRHNDISCLLPVYVTFLPSVFYFTPESLCVLKSGKAGGLGPTEQLEVGGGGLQREVRCNASHDRHSPLHIHI